jgi:hypothetical protein
MTFAKAGSLLEALNVKSQVNLQAIATANNNFDWENLFHLLLFLNLNFGSMTSSLVSNLRGVKIGSS